MSAFTSQAVRESVAIEAFGARGLVAVTLDLATTRQRIAVLNARADSDDGWDELTDRRATLEREFQEQFRQATGVDWALAQEVMS